MVRTYQACALGCVLSKTSRNVSRGFFPATAKAQSDAWICCYRSPLIFIENNSLPHFPRRYLFFNKSSAPKNKRFNVDRHPRRAFSRAIIQPGNVRREPYYFMGGSRSILQLVSTQFDRPLSIALLINVSDFLVVEQYL